MKDLAPDFIRKAQRAWEEHERRTAVQLSLDTELNSCYPEVEINSGSETNDESRNGAGQQDGNVQALFV